MRCLVVSLLMVSVGIIETQSNAKCQYYFISKKMTWEKAKKHCEEKYTYLAPADDDNIEDCLDSMADDECVWTSSDGTDQSGIQTRGEDCKVEICNLGSRGRTEKPCVKKKAFVCYMNESAVPLMLIRENKTWEDALHHCRKHNYDLVSIHNSDIQKWVEKKAKMADSPYVWLGLRYTCTLGFWFWVRDQLVCYQHWAPGNETGGCKMSGAMERGGEHHWFSLSDDQKLNFICSWNDREEEPGP